MLSPDEGQEDDGTAGISKARPSGSSTTTTAFRDEKGMNDNVLSSLEHYISLSSL